MRGVRDHLLTLAVGVLFGYIVAAVTAPLIGQHITFGAPSESSKVHAFLMSKVDDPAALVAMVASNSTDTGNDVAARALRTGAAGEKPAVVSVTYLGGSYQGPLEVHLYVVEYSLAGERALLPLTFTALEGRVLKVE